MIRHLTLKLALLNTCRATLADTAESLEFVWAQFSWILLILSIINLNPQQIIGSSTNIVLIYL